MSKFLFLLVSLLMVATNLFSQSSPTVSTLEQVGQLLAQHPCTRGNFIQEKYIPSISRSLSSSGTFLITANRGIIWQTEKPYPSIMVVGKSHISQGQNPTTMSRIDTGDNRIFMEFSQAISAAFSGNIQNVQKAFHIQFKSDVGSWILELFPKEKAVNQLIRSIVLQGNEVLEKVIMTEQNQGTVSYTFSHHSFSQEPTEDEIILLTNE